MSRAASLKIKITAAVIAVLMVAGGVWAYIAITDSSAQTVTNANHQVTQISYRGESGQNALTLLKRHASVQTKHYSFGDLVVSIDGTKGSGPKYWTFYVNNKEATVGAGSYMTKNSDTLMWKLQ